MRPAVCLAAVLVLAAGCGGTKTATRTVTVDSSAKTPFVSSQPSTRFQVPCFTGSSSACPSGEEGSTYRAKRWR